MVPAVIVRVESSTGIAVSAEIRVKAATGLLSLIPA